MYVFFVFFIIQLFNCEIGFAQSAIFIQGRLVFGNRLVPTTLCLSMEEGHMVYSTKPAMSKLDHFMHVVNCRAENFKVFIYLYFSLYSS